MRRGGHRARGDLSGTHRGVQALRDLPLRCQAPELCGVGETARRLDGRSPIPVILLARLGVDLRAQRHGLGTALAKDAMLRAHQAAGTIGARALLIHAESATGRDFYLHLEEFEPSPTDPLHLVLLMGDIEAILGE